MAFKFIAALTLAVAAVSFAAAGIIPGHHHEYAAALPLEHHYQLQQQQEEEQQQAQQHQQLYTSAVPTHSQLAHIAPAQQAQPQLQHAPSHHILLQKAHATHEHHYEPQYPDDPHPQYNFAYDVQDAVSGDSKSQSESRDGDVVQGEYSLNDADGFRRTVKYTADSVNGFNAVVHREPLKVVASSAAIAAQPQYHHEQPLSVVKAPVHYATPTYAAPVHHYEPAQQHHSTATYEQQPEQHYYHQQH